MGHDRGADNAGARRQQCADHNDSHTQTARALAKQTGHISEQVLGDFCSFQHHAHENEQGHGHEGFIAHRAEDAASQRGEVIRVKVPDQYAQRRKSQRGAAKGQRHGEAQQQHAADDNKHGERQLPFHQALSRCRSVVSARAICARA